MKRLEQKILLQIKLNSLCYPIIDYQKKYGKDDPTINLAKGEIEKFNFAGGNSRLHVGGRVNKITWEGELEYGTIWVQLGGDYFKQISKVEDSRTC